MQRLGMTYDPDKDFDDLTVSGGTAAPERGVRDQGRRLDA